MRINWRGVLRFALVIALLVVVGLGTQAAAGSPDSGRITPRGGTHQWVVIPPPGDPLREDEILIGCGDFSHGRWSKGFWTVAWDDLRERTPHQLCVMHGH